MNKIKKIVCYDIKELNIKLFVVFYDTCLTYQIDNNKQLPRIYDSYYTYDENKNDEELYYDLLRIVFCEEMADAIKEKRKVYRQGFFYFIEPSKKEKKALRKVKSHVFDEGFDLHVFNGEEKILDGKGYFKGTVELASEKPLKLDDYMFFIRVGPY